MKLLASWDMAARLVSLFCALVSLTCFVLPMYIIRPFRHQGARELAVALFVRQIGPSLAIACAVVSLAVLILSWRRMRGWLTRLAMALVCVLAIGGATLSHRSGVGADNQGLGTDVSFGGHQQPELLDEG
jgi:hypothetical protein